MQLDILLKWILCPLISVEVTCSWYFVIMDIMPTFVSGGYCTCSWIFCYYGYYALLYQWRLHAAGYFVIMDIMPSYISGGYIELDI